jgi:hypothetical protein
MVTKMSDQKNAHDQEGFDSLSGDDSIITLPTIAPPEAIEAQRRELAEKASQADAAPAASIESIEDGVLPADVIDASAKAGDVEAAKQGDPAAADVESKEPAAAAGELTTEPVPSVGETTQEPVAPAQDVAVVEKVDHEQALVGDKLGDVPVMDALRAIAGQVLADPAHASNGPNPAISGDELAKVAERLNLSGAIAADPVMAAEPAGAPTQVAPGALTAMSAGQRAQVSGVNALAEGVALAAGGTMALVGAAARGIGRVAHGLASIGDEKSGDAEFKQPVNAASSVALPAVLPRLSQYRIEQTEKAADQFASAEEAFWQASPKLTALRDEIDRLARERGVPKQDLIEEMKPGGDLADLRKQFNEAVADNSGAMAHKRSMDKAMESYVRQYGRAQEELLNPEQEGNPHYDSLKGRLNLTHKQMEDKTSGVPAFENANGELEKSHFEKLREAVAAIMERIAEVFREFKAILTGKREVEDAPAP